MTEDMDAIMTLFNTPKLEMNKKIKSKKQSYLLKHQLFTIIYQKKGQQNFNEIVEKAVIREYSFGFDIYKEGVSERAFNYILKGSAMVFVIKAQQATTTPTLYKRMTAGEYFGEKAIYGSNQKLQSVKSVSKTYVVEIDLETFYKTFSGHFVYQELKEKVQFLQSIWLFKETSRNQIQRILLVSKAHKYIKNTILFKQGEQPSFLYVVVEGELTLFKKDSEDFSMKYKPFLILTRGEVCGYEEIQTSSIYEFGGVCTSSYTVLLKIARALFEEIFIHRANMEFIEEKQKVKNQLIQAKSKKSIKISLQKLNSVSQPILNPHSKKRYSKYYQEEYGANESKLNRKPNSIFVIGNQAISKVNRLKHRSLREFTLNQIRQQTQAAHNSIRLSTYTNSSFTNDKELLLDYLVRKERRQRIAQEKQRAFANFEAYPTKELIIEKSTAVKNQKRKLKKSRQKLLASSSVPNIVK